MSQFGLSRVSEERGKPRGSDLLGLGCVWYDGLPVIAQSPNTCLFCSQGDPADASCTCGGHPGA